MTALAACLAGMTAGRARGDMVIRGYEPALHDRFYQPAAQSLFIGKALDLSGIGEAATGQWATLISPDLFLTAQHWATPLGAQVTFYTDDTRDHPVVRTVTQLASIAGGDIMIGRLDGATTGLAVYSLPAQTTASWYEGHELWVYGRPNRLGRNVVSWAGSGRMAYTYDDPGVGADECYLQPGDSGAPTFEVFGDRLVLTGLHYAIQPGGSIDSWTAWYASEIAAQASAWGERIEGLYLPAPGDANMDGAVDLQDMGLVKDHFGRTGSWSQGDFTGDGAIDLQDFGVLKGHFGQAAGGSTAAEVPEPATLVLLAAAGAAALRGRRK